VIHSILTTLTLITALGGAVWSLGDRPPWASIIRVSNIEQANMVTRYSQILEMLAKLGNKKRSVEEERWYRSLLIERQVLACQLKLEKCGN